MMSEATPPPMATRRAELVFVPAPGVGHLVSTVETAKLLVNIADHISVTVLIIRNPTDSTIATYLDSLSDTARIDFVTLPYGEPKDIQTISPARHFFGSIEEKKPYVREAMAKIVKRFESDPDSRRLAGVVMDTFCACMIDVAKEFGVPSYIFFPSGIAFLGFLCHVQALHDEQNVDTKTFKNSDETLNFPFLRHPFPAKLSPSLILSEEWIPEIMNNSRRISEAKAVLVNSFADLESDAVDCLSSGGKIPPFYPMGPILNVGGEGADVSGEEKGNIMAWLDNQPPQSVVFLCFGSMGSFSGKQVKEIADALERSGHRFLWSLRQPPKGGKESQPSDYQNTSDVLPGGFLDRTAEMGKVIGWAPQAAVLGHPAVGGFVSHCGWNSTLESLWFGVPLAAWPMYAEQQFNAFELVVELGLAVEIRMDYRKEPTGESEVVVGASEIEKGIRCVMEQETEVRKRVKEMSEKSRKALMDGGSSKSSLLRFVQDVMDSMNQHI